MTISSRQESGPEKV